MILLIPHFLFFNSHHLQCVSRYAMLQVVVYWYYIYFPHQCWQKYVGCYCWAPLKMIVYLLSRLSTGFTTVWVIDLDISLSTHVLLHTFYVEIGGNHRSWSPMLWWIWVCYSTSSANAPKQYSGFLCHYPLNVPLSSIYILYIYIHNIYPEGELINEMYGQNNFVSISPLIQGVILVCTLVTHL